jgi:hypothetical protein
MRSLLRIAALILGLFLVVLGLTTVSMCGPTLSPYGALVGALGGVTVGLLRGRRPLVWLALAGGLLGTLATLGFQHLYYGACEDLAWALLLGAGEGLGIGLLADLARPSGVPD